MRFKIDENLHQEVADLLVREGHDAETVFDEGLRGCIDPILARRCGAEGRAIVTLDLDFADIRAFPPVASAGIIVLRLHEQSRARVVRVMGQVVELLKQEAVAGQLWMVTESLIRIRGN